MSNVASTEDIVVAYCDGRAAFLPAKAVLRPETMSESERDIRQAMRELGRSLEYAMRTHLLEDRLVELPADQRTIIEKSIDFHGLVDLLAHAQPPVEDAVRKQFHRYRQRRNAAVAAHSP